MKTAQFHFRAGCLAVLDQLVPDLFEKLNLTGGRRLGRRVFLLLTAELVHALDHHEQHNGHDQKADHVIDEQPKIDGRRPGLLGRRERRIVSGVERDEHNWRNRPRR